MNKTDRNDSAYLGVYKTKNGLNRNCPGLTKREYFAALALQSMIAGSQGLQITAKQFGDNSVELADSLIQALNKE